MHYLGQVYELQRWKFLVFFNLYLFFLDFLTKSRGNTPVGTGGAGVAAALVGIIFLGAFPPVDFQAVCLSRAMLFFHQFVLWLVSKFHSKINYFRYVFTSKSNDTMTTKYFSQNKYKSQINLCCAHLLATMEFYMFVLFVITHLLVSR